MQQQQRREAAISQQRAFHQQRLQISQPASVHKGLALQQFPSAHVQAYVAFNQKDNQSDGSSDGNCRRISHDDAAFAASEHEAAQGASDRSCSSRGSSVGADVGVLDDEGRFISSLMGAQQARMRVYV
jgi:hypothetical protein